MISFFSFVAILGLSNFAILFSRPHAFPERAGSSSSLNLSLRRLVDAQASSLGVIVSVRGARAVDRAVAIMGALKQYFPEMPCSLFTDVATEEKLRRQYHENDPWCYLSRLKIQHYNNESSFVRTARDFADVAFRVHRFKSAIWINGEALPSCSQFKGLKQQMDVMSQKLNSSAALIAPEIALNLAEAAWTAVPILGISVGKANKSRRAMQDFVTHFAELLRRHGTRDVFPIRSVMLLFREAALQIQLEAESGIRKGAVSLLKLAPTPFTQRHDEGCSLGSHNEDHIFLKHNAEILGTCSRLQILGRSVALQNTPHATNAIDLPVLESALELNASFRPVRKCTDGDCFTTKHPWETGYKQVGQLEHLNISEMRAVNEIYAPPAALNKKPPSVAIITVLDVNEVFRPRDSRIYMVRIKQMFAEFSNGHITFQLYFAHELLCGDNEKSWADIKSLSSNDLPNAAEDPSVRREGAKAQRRLGLRGEFSKILAVNLALEKNARAGGAEWVVLLDSDVWLHPNLLGSGALYRILSTIPNDKVMVIANYRFFNTGFIAFRAKGAPGSAARELVRDWWAVASTPGAIECHAFDQAAAQALVLLRATNWTTKEPGEFTCTIEGKCGGNKHPVFRTCDQAYAKGLRAVGVQRFDRGNANDNPKVQGLFVLSESDRWPRPMCL